jgi:hypothetical protein
MMKILAVLVAISLAGCGMGGATVSRSEPPDIASKVEDQSQKAASVAPASPPRSADMNYLPAAPVYITMVDLPGNKMSRMAIWQGQFLVDGGCLIFRTASADYLPVYSTPRDVTVGHNTFNVAGLVLQLRLVADCDSCVFWHAGDGDGWSFGRGR